MNFLKSHFQFSKKQRSGIFALLLCVICMQGIYFFVDKRSYNYNTDSNKLTQYQNSIDSLKVLALQNSKPKIYPFNPNYITDYKGYTLGMTKQQIDRLHHFRAQNRWINSKAQFQNVTKVPDSLLNTIAPYFKFPEWVSTPKAKQNYTVNNIEKNTYTKIDLNKATATQLQQVNGVGKTLSNRIIKYRNKFKDGFIADVQLQNIYGLSPEVIQKIQNRFTVKTPRLIKKLNINTVTKDALVTVEHIDYELAAAIIEQRILRDGFKTLTELTKVKDFPIHKLEIIKLYLSVD